LTAMKNILIIDTETSGLDRATGHLLEVATALWSVEHRSVVKVRSWILRAETNAAEAVNGIPVALVREHPHASNVHMTNQWVRAWATEADCIVAHNAAFDSQWFEDDVQALPWVCSCDDLEWPRASTSRSLTALALAHGVGVVSAHRALDDVLTLTRLFERAGEMSADVSAMLTRGMRPKGRYAVSATDFSEARNALAKAAGFRWEKPHWVRRMAREDVAGLPFDVKELA